MDARTVLSKHQLKVTKQRLSVLECLMHEDQPLSAEQVYLKLKENNSMINLSTVYRMIESFVSAGILEKSTHPLTQSVMVKYHHHQHQHYLLCESCHRFIPLEDCPLHPIIHNLEHEYHFKVRSHQLEIVGLCEQCQTSV